MFKLMIFIALGYIVFDWVFYLNKDSQTPYHFNCKLASQGKMSGSPCALCEKKFLTENLKRFKNLQRDYEIKLKKPFLEFTSEEIIQMFKDSAHKS
jgi:hypothetical protein